MNRNERVVLQDVLKATVLAQLDGVQLAQLDFTPLPPTHAAEKTLSAVSLAAHDDCLAILADLVGDSLVLRWQ